MIARFNNFTDKLFLRGIDEGDILWFIDRIVRNVTQNGISFATSYITAIFCGIEIVCSLFVLTFKPCIEQILNFGPMFFTSVHTIFTLTPFILQRYTYKKIYVRYFELWPLTSANKQGLKEIRKLFNTSLFMIILYIFLVLACGIGYLPLKGVDYERSVFPAVAALRLLKDGPKSVEYFIILLNFSIVFCKGFFMSLFGWHLMHLVILYVVQNTLLRMRLADITSERWDKKKLLLFIDETSYQKWVHKELRECIKLDIKLKKFYQLLIIYLKWPILIQVGDSIAVLTMLYYMNLFMNGGYSPIGSRFFVIAANSMAFFYARHSEIFYEQISLNRQAIFETLWYTFNTSNKKTVLLFLSNLTRSNFISAGGILDLNYALLIWVMHKSFNFLTILGQMTIGTEDH